MSLGTCMSYLFAHRVSPVVSYHSVSLYNLDKTLETMQYYEQSMVAVWYVHKYPTHLVMLIQRLVATSSLCQPREYRSRHNPVGRACVRRLRCRDLPRPLTTASQINLSRRLRVRGHARVPPSSSPPEHRTSHLCSPHEVRSKIVLSARSGTLSVSLNAPAQAPFGVAVLLNLAPRFHPRHFSSQGNSAPRRTRIVLPLYSVSLGRRQSCCYRLPYWLYHKASVTAANAGL